MEKRLHPRRFRPISGPSYRPLPKTCFTISMDPKDHRGEHPWTTSNKPSSCSANTSAANSCNAKRNNPAAAAANLSLLRTTRTARRPRTTQPSDHAAAECDRAKVAEDRLRELEEELRRLRESS